MWIIKYGVGMMTESIVVHQPRIYEKVAWERVVEPAAEVARTGYCTSLSSGLGRLFSNGGSW